MNKYTCIISQLPIHDGDGYGWGGDIIITIDAREKDFQREHFSINLGRVNIGGVDPMQMARIIRNALHQYQETPDKER